MAVTDLTEEEATAAAAAHLQRFFDAGVSVQRVTGNTGGILIRVGTDDDAMFEDAQDAATWALWISGIGHAA